MATPTELGRGRMTTGSRRRGVSSPPSVVYVLGRGHSGSTLLDRLLSASTQVEGFGEIVVGLSRVDGPCACGRSVGDCPFWSSVRAHVESGAPVGWEEVVRRNQAHARIARFPWTMRVGRGDRGATEAVAAVQEITRALLLGRFVPSAALVHLVRDPVDVLASDVDRIRQGRYRFQRRTIPTRGWVLPFLVFDTATWVVGNVLAELTTARASTPALRVRYEDLCNRPVDELDRLEQAFGLRLEGSRTSASGEVALGFGHLAAGNPMRSGEPITVRPPSEKRKRLRRRERLIVQACTWPLRRRYGYTARP